MNICKYIYSKTNKENTEKDLNIILNKYKPFGIFITIKSNYDVYGCIGSYKKDITLNDIIDTLNKSLNDYKRFGREKPDLSNSKYTIEISFLYNLEPIDNKNFNNTTYGIYSSYATFLPGVFKDYTYDMIIPHLSKKAGRNELGPISQYKTYIIECKNNNNGNNMYGHSYGKDIKKPELQQEYNKICSVLNNNNRTSFIPFSTKDCTYFIEKEDEYVRNMSVLNFMISKCSKKNTLNSDSVQKLPLQSKIFILDVVNDNLRNVIISELMNNIENNNVSTFEIAEVLANVIKYKTVNDKWIKFALNKINNCLKSKNIDCLFELNWFTQFITSLKNYYINLNYNDYITYLNNFTNLNKYETNYLAVMFEMLCYLQLIDKSNILSQKIEYIYNLLEQRKTHNCPLYSFLDGSKRIDITLHVINGLEKLQGI